MLVKNGGPFLVKTDTNECRRLCRVTRRNCAFLSAGRSPSCVIVLRCLGVPSALGKTRSNAFGGHASFHRLSTEANSGAIGITRRECLVFGS